MKKSISTVMVAAMSIGAVAPVFADEIATYELNQTEEVDVRLASGISIYTESKDEQTKEVFKREEIFNYNGHPEDRTKHTLKSAYQDKAILVEKLETKPSDDLFVLSTKTNNTVEINAEKAKLETIKKEIEEYKKDGYKETVVRTDATISESDYNTGNTVVTLTKGTSEETVTITFNNIDKLSDEVAEETDKSKTDELREEVFGESILTTTTLDLKVVDKEDVTTSELDEYSNINKIKYTIEKNLGKFDIVIDESGEGNKDLQVSIYRKDAKKVTDNLVKTIVLTNVKDAVEELIITIPQTNDFTGHWAEKEIVDAMLKGQVDASATYRPQGAITRAEFAKIACTVFDIPVVEGQDEPFHDVPNNMWYQQYVAALYNKKVDGVSVVQGDGENFRPTDTITRQEVAVIVAKLTKNAVLETSIDVNGTKVDTDVETKFEDDKEIATWADESVKYLNEVAKYTDSNGEIKPISQGDQGKFNPRQSITRAESLVMVQRAASATAK